MKLMYDQLWRNPSVWLYMMRYRVRIIHLVRTNLLDIIVSVEAVKARKQPHALEGHAVETSAVTLDSATLTSTLKTLEFRLKVARWLLTRLPINHFEVSYEHLMANPSLVHDIFTFLDVDMQPASPRRQSRFRKLNTSSKRDLIANYTEVDRVLKGTRFECFLDK